MSAIGERRERERAHRHQLIVTAACELAEAEGWEAVTTRRLAERVEHGQPVLYSHFNGKEAIVSAVAMDGFSERRPPAPRAAGRPRAGAGPAGGLPRLSGVRDRAACPVPGHVRPAHRPEVRECRHTAPLRASFGEFVSCFRPDDERCGLCAEVTWSALHGMAVLSASNRVPSGRQEERLDFLVTRIAGTPAG